MDENELLQELATLRKVKATLAHDLAVANAELDRAAEDVRIAERRDRSRTLREADLRLEIDKLRGAIKLHRGQVNDDRCIEDDDALYEVLGDGIKCDRRIGNPLEMAANCIRFIKNRCEAGGPWVSYAEMAARLREIQGLLRGLRNWIPCADKPDVQTMLNHTIEQALAKIPPLPPVPEEVPCPTTPPVS